MTYWGGYWGTDYWAPAYWPGVGGAPPPPGPVAPIGALIGRASNRMRRRKTMRPISFTTPSFGAASTTALAGAQTVSGAAALVMTTTPYIVASNTNVPRYGKYVTVTSAGDDSGITFTIQGTAPGGEAQTAVIQGANIGAATTIVAFETVTSITSNGSSAGNVTAGYAQLGYTDWLPTDIYGLPIMTISVQVTGTVTYSIQVTNEDPFDLQHAPFATAHPDTDFASATTSVTSYTWEKLRAVRILFGSGTGTLLFTLVQE